LSNRLDIFPGADDAVQFNVKGIRRFRIRPFSDSIE
jgi:hypothetical protein